MEVINRHILATVYTTTRATNHCSSSACVTSILETLEACIDKGVKDTAPVWSRKLKSEWWKDMVKYILHASSNGSLKAVKYFIGKGKQPDIRYITLLSTMLDL